MQWWLNRVVNITTNHSCCPLAIILNINVVFQCKQKLLEKDCRYLTSDILCKSLNTSSLWTHPFLLLYSDTERAGTQYTLSISFQIICFWFSVWFGWQLQRAVLRLRKFMVSRCKGSLTTWGYHNIYHIYNQTNKKCTTFMPKGIHLEGRLWEFHSNISCENHRGKIWQISLIKVNLPKADFLFLFFLHAIN